MSYQLTAGICERLANLANDDEALMNSCPTVQFLSFKKVAPASGASSGVDRYRIIVSDGEHFLQAMLATQLNHLIEDEEIIKHSVAVIEKFTCNLVQDKRLLIILGLRVVAKEAPKIGSPGGLQPSAAAGGSGAASAVTAPSATVTPSISASNSPAPVPAAVQGQKQSNRSGRTGAIYPIESLSPYQNHWTIKARVTHKSDIKTWSNARGEGKLFSFNLMDETGEIKATAFNAAVDEFYDKIQDGRVYYVSKARVNLAKKQFSNLSNEYELTLERNSEIEECHDTTNVPVVKYNFIELGKLGDIPKDGICDVIGIVKEVAPLSEITSKANRTIPKRDLTLVDRSLYSVRLTLWGKQAEQWSNDDQPVIACKGVKVGDFGGRSLSMFSSSTMVLNADMPEAHALRGWYDAAGAQQTYQAYSNSMSSGAGSSISFNREEILTLDEVKNRELGQHDRQDTFHTRATIMHIKPENIAYPGCPGQGCSKKVIEESDGTWRCEKCDRSYEKPEYRYVMQMAVADYSGQAWLTGFNETGLAVFGMSADELIEIKQRDDAKYNNVIDRAIGNIFNYVCRAKQDTFNDTTRMRYSINRITPLNFREEANHLANLLRRSEWSR